ncbi:PilZ domain-containing protein [Phreatobacter sp.]|uniref:PilZ domain-containing protein n=1 Tax=Phreatobacter sp. TaxID=1966341 RepID=UPI00345AB2D4|nr:PilZ domain-containing protein [Pseudomonadota bacterium]
MTSQKRRSQRRKLGYPGYIMSLDHALLGPCAVVDISESGMLITVDPEIVPDQFLMLFTGPRGGVVRACTLVRRAETAVGVTYQAVQAADAVTSLEKLAAMTSRVKNETWKLS